MNNAARIRYCDTTREKSVDNREHKPYPKPRRHHYYSPGVADRAEFEVNVTGGNPVILVVITWNFRV